MSDYDEYDGERFEDEEYEEYEDAPERPGERPLNVGLIVGVVVAAVVGMSLVSIGIFFYLLRAEVSPSVQPAFTQMREHQARAQMRNLEAAIDAYRMRNERLPDTLETLTAADGDNPQPFLAEIPDDPWDEPYEYRILSRNSYEIRSYGEDRQPDTDDDIVLR